MRGTYDVRDHGAVGDGKAMDRQALQSAIDACRAAGGGTVFLPPGTYRSGALRLHSQVTLRLSAGARLLGSGDVEDYRIDGELVGLLSARDSGSITIRGEGVIDGNGDAFADWDSLKPGGSMAAYPDGPVSVPSRPGNLVVFANCKQVTVRDVTIRDAPFWTVHLDGCDGGRLLDLTIRNNPLVPNNDGIHCTTSRNVFIRGCDIVAGDDPIAITGINDHGPIIPGFIGYDRPTENILVRDCVLESRSCGVRVGYGHNDVRNCLFDGLIVRRSNRGLGVFARNPGSIENIRFSNIQIETKLHDGPWWGNAEVIHVSSARQFPDEPVGQVRNITFTGIRARGANGILLYGCEESPLRGITLTDVNLEVVGDPVSAARGGKIDIRPAVGEGGGFFDSPLAAVHAAQVEDLQLRNVSVHFAEEVAAYFTASVRVASFETLLAESLSAAAPPQGGEPVRLEKGDGAILRQWGPMPDGVEWVAAEEVKDLKVTTP